MPSFISPGKYMFKALVYNESKIPLSCKWFNFEYAVIEEDEEEEPTREEINMM